MKILLIYDERLRGCLPECRPNFNFAMKYEEADVYKLFFKN